MVVVVVVVAAAVAVVYVYMYMRTHTQDFSVPCVYVYAHARSRKRIFFVEPWVHALHAAIVTRHVPLNTPESSVQCPSRWHDASGLRRT